MTRKKDWNQILQEGADNYKTIIDDASSTVAYIGKSSPDNATTSNSWQIKKLVTTGSVTEILWANGDDSFNNIWDNRASLTYS